MRVAVRGCGHAAVSGACLFLSLTSFVLHATAVAVGAAGVGRVRRVGVRRALLRLLLLLEVAHRRASECE